MQPEEVNKKQENSTTESPTPQEAPAPSTPGPVVQDIVAPGQPVAQPTEPAQAPDSELKMPPPQPAEDKDSGVANEATPVSSPGPEGITESTKKKKKTKSAKAPKPPKTKTKSAKPIGFIAGVVIVSLTLMSLVVMMYLNQESDADEDPSAVPATIVPSSDDMQEAESGEDVFFDEQGESDDDETEDTNSGQDAESNNDTFTEPEEQPITE